jgi:hypothetical protein
VAHRRLAQPDPTSGASDAAFLHYSVENDQKIEIESATIHIEHVHVKRMHFKHAIVAAMLCL